MSVNTERNVFSFVQHDSYEEKFKVKYVDFKIPYLTKKQVEDSGEEINVVGYINVGDKKVKNDTYGICEVELAPNKKTQLNVYDELKGKTTLGYIIVDEDPFGAKQVLEVKKTPLLLLLLIPLLVLLICGILFVTCGKKDGTGTPGGKEPTQKEELNIADGDKFDGEIDNGYRAPEVSDEQIKVQGKSTVYIREGGTVDLVNPEDNTVLFQYKVLMDGNIIYQMDEWIKPGEKVAWNAYEQLNTPGTYTISYQIATKDINTHADCNAVNINGITAIVQ